MRPFPCHRARMGFQGIIASDDMEMGAIAKHFGFDEAITRGVDAGIDLFMVCSKPDLQEQAIERIVKCAESGSEARTRLGESQARLTALFDRCWHPPSAPSQQL